MLNYQRFFPKTQDKGAINYRTFAEEKTSVRELLLEEFKDLFVQAIFLKEMAKTQDRSLFQTF